MSFAIKNNNNNISIPMKSVKAHRFWGFPRIVVTEDEDKEELFDAGRTIDIALQWFNDNEGIDDGAVRLSSELDRERAEMQCREEERVKSYEERTKLNAILDAEFEVFWIKYLEKKKMEKKGSRASKMRVVNMRNNML